MNQTRPLWFQLTALLYYIKYFCGSLMFYLNAFYSGYVFGL